MQFRLRLDDRRDDRVFVTVCMSPEDDVVNVEGVAIELRCRSGHSLSARLMVPIRGPLGQPLAFATELRAKGEIPRGARVIGTAWTEGGNLETSCPADPGTALEAYARGSRIRLDPTDHAGPEDLSTRNHRSLARAFPWMAHFRAAEEQDNELEGIVDEQPDDLADDIAGCYGLCDEDKEFLRELLADDTDESDDELDAMLRELDDEDEDEGEGDGLRHRA